MDDYGYGLRNVLRDLDTRLVRARADHAVLVADISDMERQRATVVQLLESQEEVK